MISIKENKYFAEVVFYYEPHRLEEENNKDYKFHRVLLKESALRAKRTVLDYGYNNSWNYFITLTIDSKKIDYSDKSLILKKVLKQFDNFKQRYDKDFKYILIPEMGSIHSRLHFHGIIHTKNIQGLSYLFFDTKHRVKVYRNEWFFKHLGANQFIEINNDSEAIGRYICKYMGKNFDDEFYRVYNCWYFCSKGLNKSDVIFNGEVSDDLQFEIYRDFIKCREADFENNYIEKWVLNDKKEIERLKEKIRDYENSRYI